MSFKFEHVHALINGFITAQTAFCHYTFSIYHCTFCASLRIKKCPGALASDRHCLLQGWCQVISWLIYNNCPYDILKSFWKLFQLPGFKTMNLRFTLQKIHVF